MMSIGARKCPICNNYFSPDKEAYKLHSSGKYNGRYFHEDCYERFLREGGKEEQDRAKLYAFIREQLNIEKMTQRDIIMLNKYRKDHGYTYSGMLGTLVYFTKIKGQTMTGVGIIPYTYDDARDYFQAQAIEQERIDQFKGEAVKEVKIVMEKPKGPTPNKLRKAISMEDV